MFIIYFIQDIGITSQSVINNAEKNSYPTQKTDDGRTKLAAPGGYMFVVNDAAKDGGLLNLL